MKIFRVHFKAKTKSLEFHEKISWIFKDTAVNPTRRSENKELLKLGLRHLQYICCQSCHDVSLEFCFFMLDSFTQRF